MTNNIHSVLVTGGAGYVGAVLVPKLIKSGYRVTVLDLYLYGEDVLKSVHGNPNLVEIKGDLRDEAVLARALEGQDAVIHLACISNDPSYELNPDLGKSINYDAFVRLVPMAKEAGVKRFIYASSSSVYGIKDEPNVTEDLPLEPLTDYSKYKALCEEVLLPYCSDTFCGLVLRPATVCGWSPRLRLDLSVNILTNHAVHNRLIKVFGGSQKRPNLHIEDMTDLYVKTLELPAAMINGKIFNAGWENFSINEIAEMVRKVVGPDVKIQTTPTDDLRSYHISSDKIRKELGFVPKHTIEDAVRDLKRAFDAGEVPAAMDDPRYYNIKLMQAVTLA
jgi:nucleoside-diphosphate-sugar epimerase